MRCATFELDELPKSRRAQLDLVRFRFGRQGTSGAQACAGQALARDGGKQLVLGMAADEGWRGLVQRALAAAGMVPWSMSGNAPRQFNRFHDRLVQSSGALVALAPDAWSLWLWDDQGRPRHGRGRWREGAEDHAAIALEVERSILAYVHGGARDVARIFVVGGTETETMSAALDARLASRACGSRRTRAGLRALRVRSPRRRRCRSRRRSTDEDHGELRPGPAAARPRARGGAVGRHARARAVGRMARRRRERSAHRLATAQARLARVEEQLAAVSPQDALPAAELESLHRRIQALNKVSGIRGWSTPRLLGWLGGQLPDNVYLVSLAHKPREGEALLVAASPSAEALTAFLLRLEKEPRFAEVLLAKQGARGAPGAAAVQFEIRIRWKT